MMFVLAPWQPYIHVLGSIVKAYPSKERVTGGLSSLRSKGVNILHLVSSPPYEGKILILQ